MMNPVIMLSRLLKLLTTLRSSELMRSDNRISSHRLKRKKRAKRNWSKTQTLVRYILLKICSKVTIHCLYRVAKDSVLVVWYNKSTYPHRFVDSYHDSQFAILVNTYKVHSKHLGLIEFMDQDNRLVLTSHQFFYFYWFQDEDWHQIKSKSGRQVSLKMNEYYSIQYGHIRIYVLSDLGLETNSY